MRRSNRLLHLDIWRPELIDLSPAPARFRLHTPTILCYWHPSSQYVGQIYLHKRSQRNPVPILPNFGSQCCNPVRTDWIHSSLTETDIAIQVVSYQSLSYHEKEQSAHTHNASRSSRIRATSVCALWYALEDALYEFRLTWKLQSLGRRSKSR